MKNYIDRFSRPIFAGLLLFCASFAQAQTPVLIAPLPQLQFFDQSGRTLSFGCVFTYANNSTNPLTTYTDYTGTVPNANPVILSAGGSANIWMQAGLSYTFKVVSAGGTNCSTGTTLYTVNGIGGGVSTLTTIVTCPLGVCVFNDASQNQLFQLTLTQDVTSQPITAVGITPPGFITFEITQDGTGGHTFAWPSNSIGGCTIGSGADQLTTQQFVWDGVQAVAVGPCVTGNGPIISTGNIFDFGLGTNSVVCVDANHELNTGCGSGSLAAVTYNGETVALGGAGNVNAGSTAHSLAINEGDGNPLASVLLGVNQIPVGVTSADPTAPTIPTCSATQALNFTGTLPLACVDNTAPLPLYDASGTLISNFHYVEGMGTTDGGGSFTVTLSGAAIFADATYGCQATKIGPSSGIAYVTVNSASSVTFNAGGTQGIFWYCYGH